MKRLRERAGRAEARRASSSPRTRQASRVAPRAVKDRARRLVRASLDIVHVSAECWPFARSGGLGEVVGTLARHQSLNGAVVTVIMPLYRAVKNAGVELEKVEAPFQVAMGPGRVEHAQLYRASSRRHGIDVYFVGHDGFFDRDGLYGESGESGVDYDDNALRFALFCRAALHAVARHVPAAAILHMHDWHTALIPSLLRTEYPTHSPLARLATVLSVHNAGFQGVAPPESIDALGLAPALYEWRTLEWYGRVNILKGGVALADAVVTVSPTHGEELRTPAGGFGLHAAFAAKGGRLTGILNAIDTDVWNPASDPRIPCRYSALDLRGKRRCKATLQRAFGLPETNAVPLVAMCARLTSQKGIALVLEIMPLIDGVQFIVLGEGDARYTAALSSLIQLYPARIAADFFFRDASEHRLLAGADLLLMPSLYEPCGLTQMRAQRYGAIPVARRVGGLADTIRDGVTGFLFDDYSAAALSAALARALAAYGNAETWNALVQAAMSMEFGWEQSARAYHEVYLRALEHRASASRD